MEFLPRELVAAMTAAARPDRGKRTRLRVQSGETSWPVLRRWRGGFALDASRIEHLRGYVDLYEGGRHIATALIVASEIEGEELICTIKRETPVSDKAALDFVRPDGAPAGYLPPA